MGKEEEKALRDLWSRTLSQIPTTFGCLVYLASLRDPNTGRYHHYGLAQVYTELQAERALRLSHIQAFNEWLGLSLEQQRSDLEEYLSSLEGDRRTVLENWKTLSPYKNLPPADASQAQRQLFVSDLEIILELLRRELSPFSRLPGA